MFRPKSEPKEMKISFKIILLSVFVSFFAWSACSTKKHSDPYYKISNRFKQYCLFKEQSRWTYKNDSSGALYNLNISDISSYIGFHSPDNIAGPYSYDVIDMTFDSANGLNFLKGSITAGNPTTGTGSMTDEYWLFFKNGNYLLAFAPGYPMGEEQRLGNNPGYYTNLEKMPEFSLNGNTYDSVYQTQVRKTEGTPDTVKYQFYFALHYGLIKWTRTVKGETKSFSLTTSNLLQK